MIHNARVMAEIISQTRGVSSAAEELETLFDTAISNAAEYYELAATISAIGPKPTSNLMQSISAFGGKADIEAKPLYFRF